MLKSVTKNKMNPGLIAVEKIRKINKNLKNVLLKAKFVILVLLQWRKCLNAD